MSARLAFVEARNRLGAQQEAKNKVKDSQRRALSHGLNNDQSSPLPQNKPKSKETPSLSHVVRKKLFKAKTTAGTTEDDARVAHQLQVQPNTAANPSSSEITLVPETDHTPSACDRERRMEEGSDDVGEDGLEEWHDTVDNDAVEWRNETDADAITLTDTNQPTRE